MTKRTTSSRTRTTSILLAFGIACGASACTVGDPEEGPDEIGSLESPSSATFYEHSGWGGYSFSWYGELNWVGGWWNDRISSVDLPANTRVALYEHIHFGGRVHVIRESTDYVGRFQNDWASSLAIYSTQDDECGPYESYCDGDIATYCETRDPSRYYLVRANCADEGGTCIDGGGGYYGCSTWN